MGKFSNNIEKNVYIIKYKYFLVYYINKYSYKFIYFNYKFIDFKKYFLKNNNIYINYIWINLFTY